MIPSPAIDQNTITEWLQTTSRTFAVRSNLLATPVQPDRTMIAATSSVTQTYPIKVGVGRSHSASRFTKVDVEADEHCGPLKLTVARIEGIARAPTTGGKDFAHQD